MKNDKQAAAAVEAEVDAVSLLMADHKRVNRLFADFKNLKEDGSDEQKSAVVAQICKELTLHTILEEEIFYPAVREAIDDEDLMDEALVEHAGAKDLIAQLQDAHPDDDLYDAKVTVLGEQIDHHVLEEEGDMFPRARHSGLDLKDLAARMMERRSTGTTMSDDARGTTRPPPARPTPQPPPRSIKKAEPPPRSVKKAEPPSRSIKQAAAVKNTTKTAAKKRR